MSSGIPLGNQGINRPEICSRGHLGRPYPVSLFYDALMDAQYLVLKRDTCVFTGMGHSWGCGIQIIIRI